METDCDIHPMRIENRIKGFAFGSDFGLDEMFNHQLDEKYEI